MSTNNAINVPLLGHTGTGQFVGDTSPTIATPLIGQINDTNGNGALLIVPTASAVNYFQMSNSATLNNLIFRAIGTDTNISISYIPKGTGVNGLYSLATTNQLVIGSGATYQHTTYLSFPSSAASTTLTFPDATGTVALTSDISSLAVLKSPAGAQTITGFGLTVPSLQLSTNNALLDSNGNLILELSPQASAVNNLTIANSPTGSPVALFASGADTNIPIVFQPKGTGYSQFNSISGTPIEFSSGTGYQHLTGFAFANTSANRTVTFQDATGTLCMDTSSSGSISTSPPVSASSSLVVGTAYQNTLGYDVVLTVYLAVSAATAASILLGVGPTNTPTQQTIVSGLTLAALGIIPVTIYLPTGYYALLSVSGTITQTISGQQAMPV